MNKSIEKIQKVFESTFHTKCRKNDIDFLCVDTDYLFEISNTDGYEHQLSFNIKNHRMLIRLKTTFENFDCCYLFDEPKLVELFTEYIGTDSPLEVLSYCDWGIIALNDSLIIGVKNEDDKIVACWEFLNHYKSDVCHDIYDDYGLVLWDTLWNVV